MTPAAKQTRPPDAKPGPSPSASAPADAKDDLKSLPLEEVERRLESSPAGLSAAEAQKRLGKYGPNEIEEIRENAFLHFLTYFWGPIPWMIEGAVLLSAVVRHWSDVAIILLLLVSNAVVGFWEEHQAGNAIAALKAKLAVVARAKRDGKWLAPPARDLVPGDVIRLRLGDIVPADARLLEGDPVEVDQSALTGESLPATRKTGEAVFSGSIIRQGEAEALVYATGVHTYFGKTAQLVQEAHTVSHFQRAVLKIGDYLIVLAAALVAVIIAVALFRGDPILTTLQFALVLTVAAIPVAMPTVLSVTMAVGARLLAGKQAIVSRLAAIEELAGVDILCSDKTGTLTQNKLTLGVPFAVEGIAADQVILDAALASRRENQDPIDLAVLAGMKDAQTVSGQRVVHFQPFDPVHKRTEATVQEADGKTFKVTKGAPQVILALVASAPPVKAAGAKAVDEFAARGFRSLGVARADGDGPWQLRGVLPLFNPPREQAKATISTARQMGVNVKMVTGDQLAIARETAAALGLGTGILDASGFGDTKHHETAQLAASIERADGFAQVFPEHKFHIVDVLQQRGHIVGMTGDGVNDAPALKKADCGIAVSGATDAARAAASIVLMTPGLSVIIDAIKESRKIFQRMNSYAIYRIAETLRVLLFMTVAILVFNFYPVTAVMIVMLALLNDGAILSIAYDNVHYQDKPEAWNMRLVLGVSTVLGVIGVVSAFGLFYLGERVFHLDRAHVQTLMYLKLSVAGHLTIFLTRTRGPFWSIRPARALLVAVCGTQLVATLIAVYGLFMTPLGWGWALFVWGYALVWFLVNDRVKLLAYKIFDPTKLALASARPRQVQTVAERAYELYEQHGRKEDHADQDWSQAERELRASGGRCASDMMTRTSPFLAAGTSLGRSGEHVTTSPLAGKPADPLTLVDVPALVTAYYTQTPDPRVAGQRVAFGTSGHRGSSPDRAFNERHILAISQAICLHRRKQRIDGPLFLGMDTHALSLPALASALEVLAANGVEVMLAEGDEYTPTPAVSHAILTYNRGRKAGLADGIVITPSHNPPRDGGFKYNPPDGGPAEVGITDGIGARANELIEAGLEGVKRVPYERALHAPTTHRHDYLDAYVGDLGSVVDMDVIRGSKLSLGVDPLGGAGVHYWGRIAERYGLDLVVVSETVDPTFRFMTVDWDGQIRMDPSSPYAMKRLIALQDRFGIAFACDTDHDRHGIVTRSAGLLPPNHYLAVAISYLFRHRPGWSAAAAVGKTMVSSQPIDRVAAKLGRKLHEVPVGFKWFVEGLLDGSLGFGGEESAGASFLRTDGGVWTTDKDGIAPALLSGEITARMGRDPGELDRELTRELGEPVYDRVEAKATPAQKAALERLSPHQVRSADLAGEKIQAIQAPGNGEPLGGVKVVAESGWFAARPSGTEQIYKIYAESFRGADHLRRILEEAQAMVDAAIRASSAKKRPRTSGEE